MIFGSQEADEHGKELKPWVRAVITLWVVMVVLAVLVGLMMLIIYGPWAIATTWDSFFIQYAQVSRAFEEGGMIDGVLGLVDLGFLMISMVGGALLLAQASMRWSVAVWRWTRGRLLLRLGIALTLIAIVALSLLLSTTSG